eukprot:1709752-Pyramimonas_sp.AAC.1
MKGALVLWVEGGVVREGGLALGCPGPAEAMGNSPLPPAIRRSGAPTWPSQALGGGLEQAS